MTELTLGMWVPNSTGGWTLAEAVESLKSRRLTRLLVNDDEELSEHVCLFERALRRRETPTTGQVWAAWYCAATEALEHEYWFEETITMEQYRARKAAITRLVFRKKF